MGILDQVHKGRKQAPRRVLLYGVEGIGKTTFAAMAPDAIFLPTEEGQGDIDCESLPLATTYEQAVAALSALYTEDHKYRTVVVDSLDWLEQLIWHKVCQAKGVQNIADIGYAKGYDLAITFWRDFLAGLSALRQDRGMMIVLIAHAKIERFEDPETQPYDRYMPRLHKRAAAMVQEWCDEVLFATYKVYTKSVEEGYGRTTTTGIGTGVRVLKTTERPANMAKNRLGLPDEMPFAWAEYAKFLQQAQGV